MNLAAVCAIASWNAAASGKAPRSVSNALKRRADMADAGRKTAFDFEGFARLEKSSLPAELGAIHAPSPPVPA